MTTKFLLCFVPLFVAVDAIGLLPMFMSLTEDVDKSQVRRIVLQSVATAMAVSLAFVAIGELLLRLLGITVADFMIAGGTLLFGISLSDLLTLEKQHGRIDAESLGAVPVGVPLIVGPAVLTTTILLVHQQGAVVTSGALIVNILLSGVVLWFSDSFLKVLGKVGAKTISKLANILLAAIGVMMVRKGIMLFIGH
jgi:multiple antibiotic resistance protein